MILLELLINELSGALDRPFRHRYKECVHETTDQGSQAHDHQDGQESGQAHPDHDQGQGESSVTPQVPKSPKVLKVPKVHLNKEQYTL